MLQTVRPQQKYARKFVNALSCSSASKRQTMTRFAQVIFPERARSLPSSSCLGALLIFGFRVRCHSRLERNTMIGP